VGPLEGRHVARRAALGDPVTRRDTAWWTGLWDRSEEYEPLPFSMFVIPIWIPCCCVAVALGLGVRHATDRRRGRA
jgi:hypothetical protein